MDDYDSMYSIDDDQDDQDDVALEDKSFSSSIIDKGIVKEIEINGKKIEVVDVSTILRLERILKFQLKKIKQFEFNIDIQKNKISNLERRVYELSRELDGKVSYEK